MFVHVTVRASACRANTVEDSKMVDKNETEMLLRPISVSGCDPGHCVCLLREIPFPQDTSTLETLEVRGSYYNKLVML